MRMPTVEDAVALLTDHRSRVTGRQEQGMILMSPPKVIGALISSGATAEEAAALLDQALERAGGEIRLSEVAYARGTQTKTVREYWIPLTAVRY